MDANFWLQRWNKNQIGFHEEAPNRLLTEYWARLELPAASRVFLPLCGKTRDIGWLLGQGYRVVGAELSQDAVEQLFGSLGLTAQVSTAGALRRYDAGELTVFAGDFFELSAERLGPVDAIYDRAALVAMPEDMRAQYVEHLMQITACASQFLVCFEYDQALMDGPPFSVDASRITDYYGSAYELSQIVSKVVSGGLKGICPANEVAWVLRRPV